MECILSKSFVCKEFVLFLRNVTMTATALVTTGAMVWTEWMSSENRSMVYQWNMALVLTHILVDLVMVDRMSMVLHHVATAGIIWISFSLPTEIQQTNVHQKIVSALLHMEISSLFLGMRFLFFTEATQRRWNDIAFAATFFYYRVWNLGPNLLFQTRFYEDLRIVHYVYSPTLVYLGVLLLGIFFALNVFWFMQILGKIFSSFVPESVAWSWETQCRSEKAIAFASLAAPFFAWYFPVTPYKGYFDVERIGISILSITSMNFHSLIYDSISFTENAEVNLRECSDLVTDVLAIHFRCFSSLWVHSPDPRNVLLPSFLVHTISFLGWSHAMKQLPPRPLPLKDGYRTPAMWSTLSLVFDSILFVTLLPNAASIAQFLAATWSLICVKIVQPFGAYSHLAFHVLLWAQIYTMRQPFFIDYSGNGYGGGRPAPHTPLAGGTPRTPVARFARGYQ